jgi:hypothetical protein
MPKIVPCYFLQGKATKTHKDRGLYDDPVWSFLSNIDFSLFFSLLAGNRGVGDGETKPKSQQNPAGSGLIAGNGDLGSKRLGSNVCFREEESWAATRRSACMLVRQASGRSLTRSRPSRSFNSKSNRSMNVKGVFSAEVESPFEKRNHCGETQSSPSPVQGTCPPHDGVRRRWWINVASASLRSRARKKSDDLTTAIVLAGTSLPASAGTENLVPYAVASLFVQLKSVLSTHVRCRMTASLRATATLALRSPVRLASLRSAARS